MIRVYAVVLVVGLIALVAWILAHALYSDSDRDRFDPESRFGVPGRRVVAGLVGFSMAGLSAEFSPRDLSWQLALALATVGAAVMVWYAGRANLAAPSNVPSPEAQSTETPD